MAEPTRVFKPKKTSFEATMAVVIGRGNLRELLIIHSLCLIVFALLELFTVFISMANSLQESKLQ